MNAFQVASRASDLLSLLLLCSPNEGAIMANVSPKRRKDLLRLTKLHWRSNIIGIAVGEKCAQRTPITGQLCLKFFVRNKLAKSRLRRDERIPTELTIDSIEGNILTDVEAFPGTPVAHFGQLIRPIRPGSSVGHFLGINGTIGLIVKQVGTNKPLLLGCSHVLARAGLAQPGDPIEQPGDTDRVIGQNVIGRLARFTSIRVDALNTMDAALVEIDANKTVDSAILDIGRPNNILRLSAAMINSMVGVPLVRSGDGTGRQDGSILGIRATFPVQIPTLNDQIAIFKDLVLYRSRCGPGDSGAAVLDRRTNNVLGIHIAGVQDIGLFTLIQPVFSQFGIELF